MKRLAIIVVMTLMSLTATANSIRFFTYSQAARTVQYLNAQNEMMIYCGYDYEIETYVLINEVWMERYNSSYYEIWVYGYDAYTGDEIYMPLDLKCVWLFSGGRMYSAAQYLRFHSTITMPSITWYVPAYHHYTRVAHRPGYRPSYHYEIHSYGWMPPAPGPAYGSHGPLPPYYNRPPHTPAPRPTAPWTPGVDRPTIGTTTGSVDVTNNAKPTTGSHNSTNTSARPGSTSASGSSRSTTSGTSTSTTTRSNSSTATSGTSRSTSSSTTTRSSNSGTTPTRSNSGTSATGRSSTSSTPTRSSSSTSATPTRSSSASGTTTRSSSTTTTRSSATTSTTRSTGSTTSSRSSDNNTSRSNTTSSRTTTSRNTTSRTR